MGAFGGSWSSCGEMSRCGGGEGVGVVSGWGVCSIPANCYKG